MGAARIRSIRPQLIASERFAGLTDAAARLFYGMVSLADDFGNLPGGPSYLNGQIFYARPRSLIAIGKLITELEVAGFVRRYAVDGAPYLGIAGWSDERAPTYQRIEKKKTATYPARKSSDSRNAFPEDSRPEREGEREGEVEGSADPGDHHGAHADPPTSLSPERPGSTRPPASTSDEDQISELPDDWQPNEAHRALAAARGLAIVEVARKFREKHTRGRRTRTEWDRYFASWLEREYPDRTPKPLRFKYEEKPAPIPEYMRAGSGGRS